MLYSVTIYQERENNYRPMKVVIPMGGLGTRLRPHTWSKPKQLVSVAGKAVLDHVIDIFDSLPDRQDIELVNIVGHLGEQIEAHVRERYPHIKAHFIVQENPRGQSHAIWLARDYLEGPMLMVFADTLIETDLSCLAETTGEAGVAHDAGLASEAIAWVKEVPDPRRFGVAQLGSNGWVSRLIEKPQTMENNLAVVGFYYFKDSQALLSAIEEQMLRGLELKGEYFLVDAINIMLERGLKMHTCPVEVWLDAGTPETLLETNRYLLEHGMDNSQEAAKRQSGVVVPPVFIHPSASIENSIIGPYVSLGAGCRVSHSIIENSILEDEAQANNIILEKSLVGRRASLTRRAGMINAGDNTEVTL
jgi:glucose-1-phosphate thymidylyltransferase